MYSPDVLADPSGNGYIMWYGGWQTQQTVDSGQFDTIYRRTAPTPNGPWSDPTTEIVASQVAPQITEVNDPSVSITSVNGSLQYTMFFTSLQCKPGTPGCSTVLQLAANGQVWSATSADGINWGSFQPVNIPDPQHSGVASPSVVLQPSGAQQWLVYYGSGCLIGVASVDANRNVLSSSIVYTGPGTQCMANPFVFQSGTTWHMFFDVLEPTSIDSFRFDVWKTSSASPTDWSGATSTPVDIVNGVQQCAAITSAVLPVSDNQFDLYFGLVVPSISGVCNDLTQSKSIVMSPTMTGHPLRQLPDPATAGPALGAAASAAPCPQPTLVGMAATPTAVTGWSRRRGVTSATPASTGRWADRRRPDRGDGPTRTARVLAGGQAGIFAFGDAAFDGWGDTAEPADRGMAATADGHGYWLVASDGGIFSFGTADFDGSVGAPPQPTHRRDGVDRRQPGLLVGGQRRRHPSVSAMPGFRGSAGRTAPGLR